MKLLLLTLTAVSTLAASAFANLGDTTHQTKARYGSSVGPTTMNGMERWVYRHGGFDIYVQYNTLGKADCIEYVKTPVRSITNESVYGFFSEIELQRLISQNVPSGVAFSEDSEIQGNRAWTTVDGAIGAVLYYGTMHDVRGNNYTVQTLRIATADGFIRANSIVNASQDAQQDATAPMVGSNNNI